MNPVEAFLSDGDLEKQAIPQWMSNVTQHLPEQAAQAAATAGVGAAVMGVGVGMHALYQAAMKGRNFRKMLEFNEDLAAQHQENPKYVNAAFSTLHRMNSSFSSDPMVAGAYVRQMVADPNAAFGQAGLAAGYAPRPGAIQEAALGGVRSGNSQSDTMGRQVENERMKSIFKTLGDRQKVRGSEREMETNEPVLQRLRGERRG